MHNMTALFIKCKECIISIKYVDQDQQLRKLTLDSDMPGYGWAP